MPGGEGHAEGDLWQAPVAPVRSHHPHVVADREHGAGRVGVAVHGGHGGAREREVGGEQVVDPVQVGLELFGVGAEPVEVEPVREELARPHRDEGARPLRRGHRRQVTFDRAEQLRRQPVLAVVHGHDEDVAVAVQGDHGPGT